MLIGWIADFWHLSSLSAVCQLYDDNLTLWCQGFQSGPVPGTFTRLRSCIVPVEITEPHKISGGQKQKYDGR